MEKGIRKEDVFSKVVRAGKRTYFFDVKSTKADDYYLTLTESTKRFNDDGSFKYEKHRLFLYKEDFEKFALNLKEVMDYIISERGETPIRSDHNNPQTNGHGTVATETSPASENEPETEEEPGDKNKETPNDFTDVDFDTLGTDGPDDTADQEQEAIDPETPKPE